MAKSILNSLYIKFAVREIRCFFRDMFTKSAVFCDLLMKFAVFPGYFDEICRFFNILRQNSRFPAIL